MGTGANARAKAKYTVNMASSSYTTHKIRAKVSNGGQHRLNNLFVRHVRRASIIFYKPGLDT